jgi:hypothetical protein
MTSFGCPINIAHATVKPSMLPRKQMEDAGEPFAQRSIGSMQQWSRALNLSIQQSWSNVL